MILTSVKNYPKQYYKHPYARTGSKRAPVDTQRVYPVLKAEQLLLLKDRKQLVHQIRAQSGAPLDYFKVLYQQLIHNYAEFVQNLPTLKNHRLRRLDRQLYLASTALSLREPYIMAGELLNRTTSHEKALWNYVMFSSVLLSKLGELVTQYKVNLVDDKGVFEKNWEPFIGSMNGQGTHYKIRHLSDKKTSVQPQINILLAKQLMPLDGFLWIASNPDALEQWILGLQTGFEEGTGGLIAEFYALLQKTLIEQRNLQQLEDKELYLEYLEELLEEEIFKNDQFGEFPPLVATEPVTTLAGEKFYQWLRDGIERGTVTVNQKDSAVFMTEEGVLLLHPDIINKFRETNPQYSPKQVFDQFSKLGIAASGALYQYVTKFPGMAERTVQGLMLKDPNVLLPAQKFAQISPFLVRANVLKQATEKRVTEHQITENRAREAARTAHESDLDRKASASQYPEIRYASDGTSIQPTSSNKPTRRSGY